MGNLKTFTIHNYYTREIPIDDGVDGDAVAAGQTFPIRIRRFTVAELQAFQRGFARVVNPSANRFIFRKPDGDEQVLRDDGRTHQVPQEEIDRRRVAEMTPETRAAHEAASQADDVFMATFCGEAIADHVWLPKGVTVKVILDDDSEEIATDGAGLVRAFGGNLSMLVRLTSAIHQENTLSPEQKKVLRLLSDSTTSSPARAADGATPAAIATRVEPAASVSSGAASGDPAPSPSGSIAT